jgi:hypothetical protein
VRLGLLLVLLVLLLGVACSSHVREPVPADVRVDGPSGLSYAVPAGPWTVQEHDLGFTGPGGRSVAHLTGSATFDQGYADGRCLEPFSARAVVGFARGPSHARLVRRFERAIGASTSLPSRAAPWLVTLPDGQRARLTRTVLDVADPGECGAPQVAIDVLTPVRDDVRATGRVTAWVYVGDRGPHAAPQHELAAMAASLRSSTTKP